MKLKEQIRPEGGAHPWIKTTETETLLIDIDLISVRLSPCTDPSHQNMTRLSILVQRVGGEEQLFSGKCYMMEIMCLVSKHPPRQYFKFSLFHLRQDWHL